MLTTVLATLVVLGVLIFVHELGHFMTAKWVDIEVPRFSIGFGPKVFGFRRGETEYVISLLPLGGYVKMAGMEEMEAIEGGAVNVGEHAADAVNVGEHAADAVEHVDAHEKAHRPRDFESKSLPARALVISAGVIMNMLFAFVVFSIIVGIWGVEGDPGTRVGGIREELLPAEATGLLEIQPGSRVAAVNGRPVTTRSELNFELMRARAGETTLTFDAGDTLRFSLPSRDEHRLNAIAALEIFTDIRPVIGQVIGNGPGRDAGLQRGDTIVAVAGQPVTSWQDFVALIERRPGIAVPLVIARAGQRLDLVVTPEERVLDNGLRIGRVGVGPLDTPLLPRERVSASHAIREGAAQTWGVTAATLDLLSGMFTGRQSARSLGGPIMIGQLSGQFARAGIEQFLSFMAVLSISLAILNMLPIPVLDGGHLVFLAIEGVRGRPLSYQSRMRLTQIGFLLIILLMVWAVGNDVLRVLGI
ncbi:MAG TPA: RIP metalloprotease RseP [Longimicrobiales bacterium]|nr:RIP metalloprotease RseP [Longimicrobiales bacterium]